MQPASPSPGVTGHDDATAWQDNAFGQWVRQALAHLHDLTFLQTHPLAKLLAVHDQGNAATGQSVQVRLLEVIEQLRPDSDTPAADRAWRGYRLLHGRYVEGLDVLEVSLRLGIGRREFFREHRRALEAVVSLLRHQFLSPASRDDRGPRSGVWVSARPAPPAHPRPLGLPLVGRDEELKFLLAEYDAVVAGEGGRMVLLCGDPGVGKTRLVHELGHYAQRLGGGFLHGRYARAATGPYAPWVEALRGGLQGLTRRDLAEIVGPYGRDLAAVLPEVTETVGGTGISPALDANDLRLRLYDGVARLVVQLAQRAPLVLLLDDLQWATGMTLLAHVRQRIGAARVLLVGVYRTDEFADQPGLVRERDDLYRARLFTPLVLHPLTPDTTAQMAACSFGASVARQLGDGLFRTTHGNPFFIEEVLRSLVENGAVQPDLEGWTVVNPSGVQLPDSLKLAVEARVARLGEEVRAMLLHAAVLGQQFSFTVLEAMTGDRSEALAAQLERALMAGLLLDVSTSTEERFAFADDQIVEVLYGGMPSIRRRRLHRLAGEAIEMLARGRDDAQVEQLARHFAESNDPEKASSYAFRAGRKAEDVYLWSRAYQFYLKALALWECLGGHAEQRAAAYERLGLLSFNADCGPAENLGFLEKALALYEEFGDHRKTAAILAQIGREYATGGSSGDITALTRP